MSSQPGATDVPLAVEAKPNPPQLASIGWALRRTALWLLMMFAMVVVGAWLFYASIDPDEAVAGAPTTTELPASR